jgi:ribulose-phosphate 3-epimerase
MRTTAQRLLERAPDLSVGILTADLLQLGQELELMDDAGIELIHVDVMDGVFCPMTTVGPPIVQAIPDRFVADVHLMVDEPLDKVHRYVEAGAGVVTFHIEATRHPHRVLQSLAGTGVVRGVALNPGTPVAAIEPLVDELELVLVLAVNPGWPGQGFISSTERRLLELREIVGIGEIVVAADGGITRENVERLGSLGVDLVVTGSAVYDGGSACDNARAMLEAVRQARGGIEQSPEQGDPTVLAAVTKEGK